MLSFELVRISSEGLEIFAFPCNNFGSQEPGTNDEILQFASEKGAKYPVFGKLQCEAGDKTHPLYQYLTSSVSSMIGSGLKWNFAKFLCDSQGIPVKRYLPVNSPLSIESDIVQLLKKSNAEL